MSDTTQPAANDEYDTLRGALVAAEKIAIEMRANIATLVANMHTEQTGALLYIAAIVHKFSDHTGTVRMTDKEMRAALPLILERADAPDGGLILRVTRPRDDDVEPPLIITPEEEGQRRAIALGATAPKIIQ